MATRMQQRRGTAAQWTAANPVLAAGEIGFETDNNRFKIGNGATAWTALDYFANSAALTALLDGAPEALDTINELALALNNDPDFFTTVSTNLSTHAADTTGIHGIDDTSLLATKSYSDSGVNTHADQTLNIHGIANTELLITTQELTDYTASEVQGHNTTISVHGIADTSLLATTEYVDSAVSSATGDYPSLAGDGLTWNEETEAFDVDETIATTQYADSEVTAHSDLTENIHGIADTAELATKTYADDAVTSHNNSTIDVHGIANTALLATESYVDDAETDAITAAEGYTDGAITTAVAALTKTSVGLANVDNTADVDKPVSNDTQDALDLKANLAGPTFTGTVTTDDLIVEGDLTVTGTTTTINATDLSITDPLIYLASNQYTEDVLDVGFLAATGAPGGTEEDHLHSGFFRDASDSKKWKLVSNVPHPVGNVVDITNATKETLVVGALEATTVNPSSGVVFSDGTQTKEGVPSRTPIVQKTASYALSTLTHRDSMIEMSSASAMTLTIPLDSTVDYPIGTTVDILQTNTGQVTIAGAAGVTVNATPGLKLRTRWSSATLMKRAANTWVVYGDLTA